jgi:asparagine synthase (glutamine-hydrolysing)
MIELGQSSPAHLKLAGDPLVEKWILRKAFEDLLPTEIVWRTKEQFDEGSGTVDLLTQMLSQVMSEDQAQVYRQKHPEARLRSAEECYYHQIFMDVFEQPESILANVARWSERPI